MFLPSSPPPHTESIAQQCVRYFEALKSAHRDVLAELKSLERLTREPSVCQERYGAVRWRLGQASLNRRAVWNSVYACLARRARVRVFAWDGVDSRTQAAGSARSVRSPTATAWAFGRGLFGGEWSEGYVLFSRPMNGPLSRG